MLSEELEFSRALCASGGGGCRGLLSLLILVRLSSPMLPALLICIRERQAPQEHGGKRAFWARLLRMVFLLKGFLVCTVSLGQVGGISSSVMKNKASYLG